MAGRGPAPAEQRQRARDVKPPSDQLPAEGYTGEYPPLPKSWRQELTIWERDPDTREKHPVTRIKHVRFLPVTREWYEEFATSPMAARFTKVDWNRLRMVLAPLRDQLHRGNYALAGEIRLQETRLGATVRDRQEMRVQIAKAPEERRGPVAAVSNLADRKERLQAGPKQTA